MSAKERPGGPRWAEREPYVPAPQTKFVLSSGPVSVHERVSLALARAPYDHEDPDFQEIFRDTTEKLKQVFRTAHDAIIMQGEAVLGLEAAAANLVEPGDKCLNLVSGVYGAGYRRYFDFYGGQVVELAVPYNEAITEILDQAATRSGFSEDEAMQLAREEIAALRRERRKRRS